MKIRIKGNSIRYRLSKTDIARFAKDTYIQETIEFGDQTLTYALQQTPSDKLASTFNNNKITLLMPVGLAAEWVITDRVGFDGYDNQLYILIEKDFQCLDNVAEDQSDNYPNPKTC
jgi:hypothetical protein